MIEEYTNDDSSSESSSKKVRQSADVHLQMKDFHKYEFNVD